MSLFEHDEARGYLEAADATVVAESGLKELNGDGGASAQNETLPKAQLSRVRPLDHNGRKPSISGGMSSHRRMSLGQVKGSVTVSNSQAGLTAPGVAAFDPKMRQWIQKKTSVRPELASLAPLLNALIPISLSETMATKNLSGPLRTKALADYLVKFLSAECESARASANSAMAIIVDDAQVRSFLIEHGGRFFFSPS
jgi:hypothetical protein